MESMRLRQVTEISPIGGKVEEGARWPGIGLTAAAVIEKWEGMTPSRSATLVT